MGIVVTIAMLLGLIMALPKSCGPLSTISNSAQFIHAASLLLVAMGSWNSLWYGLRNLDLFWGMAGLVSGIIMILVGIIQLADQTEKPVANWLQNLSSFLRPFRAILFVGLLASFLLYAVTLIQLNLGYPIIG